MISATHLIDGQCVAGEGINVSRPSPVSREAIALAPLVSAEQAVKSAQAATRAAPDMATLDISQRAAVLCDLANRIEADAQSIADLVTLENGCPCDQAVGLQIGSAAGLLRAYADLALTHSFEERRTGLRGGYTHILRQPVGPALGIVPWNVPLFLACMKLAPAIAAGCPIVLKPSPESADSMGRFAQHLSQLELPAGGVQSVIGDADIGRAMVEDPSFAKISFTGSTPAGRAVGMAAMERFARVTLELGGKSAAIILDDVDPTALPSELWLAIMQNNGQVCGAQSRILVPASRVKAYEDAIAALFDGLVTADPRESGTKVGPVVSAKAAAAIKEVVAAEIALGGQRLTQDRPVRGGAFVAPTLIRPSAQSAVILERELFGPVATIQPYRDEDEAIALANDHRYGLSGSVWSSDTDRAVAVARQLKTGTVGINTKKILDYSSPFGGWRSSGIGRELGPEGINAYTETSTIIAG